MIGDKNFGYYGLDRYVPTIMYLVRSTEYVVDMSSHFPTSKRDWFGSLFSIKWVS